MWNSSLKSPKAVFIFYTILNLWRHNGNRKNMIENEVITKKEK